MTAPASTHIIAALADSDLKDRFKAIAPLCGWTGAEVESAWERIVVTAVDDAGDATVADVHAYAKNLYDQALAAVPAAPARTPRRSITSVTSSPHSRRQLLAPDRPDSRKEMSI